MRIVVFEDNDDKFERIASVLNGQAVSDEEIIRIRFLGEFFRQDKRRFDLCIIDLKMPYVENGQTVDASSEILKMVDDACGFSIPVIAITEFMDELSQHAETFAKKGCLLLDYAREEVWTSAISANIRRAVDRHRYHFIIFTALESERNAYAQISSLKIDRVRKSGLEFWETSIDGHAGAVVCLPRMGLVNSAIVASRVLENYSPLIVCMSGICAGIGKETLLGQLLVTDVCWEYQSGKWSDTEVEPLQEMEAYQESISGSLRGEISSLINDPYLLKDIEQGFPDGARPKKASAPKFAVMASGSAVIASMKMIGRIRGQHRKLQGLDMELYAFHRAVALCSPETKHFSAKAVVDKGDAKKNNRLHRYASYISAAFCIKVITSQLP